MRDAISSRTSSQGRARDEFFNVGLQDPTPYPRPLIYSMDGTHLTVIHKQKVNPLRFWHLVKCINEKSANGNGHSA
jgi:hypothetical protein